MHAVEVSKELNVDDMWVLQTISAYFLTGLSLCEGSWVTIRFGIPKQTMLKTLLETVPTCEGVSFTNSSSLGLFCSSSLILSLSAETWLLIKLYSSVTAILLFYIKQGIPNLMPMVIDKVITNQHHGNSGKCSNSPSKCNI